MRDDATAVKHWETGRGGGLWAAVVGGPMPGKGWHLLFAPSGACNGANLGGDADHLTKIDFRGLGGYIVVPPSIHPLGHRYTWDEERGPDRELPTTPGWLTALLNADDNPFR